MEAAPVRTGLTGLGLFYRIFKTKKNVSFILILRFAG
jgi:hypothetical protein